jgi:flagellar motility protein MotE (MotC chaperone)
MFGFNRGNTGDVTGAVPAVEGEKPSDPALRVSDKPPDPTKLEVAGAAIPLEPGRITSPGERAVLERLQTRRQELDTRNRELEMRENLLKAAEKRLEAKVSELRSTESRVNTAMGTRDKVEAERFKSIITMYENMKAKDAARIFDRLDMKILVDVSTQMNPRKMSEILGQMSPDAAERLTVELANRATSQPKTQNPDQLPKIEGKPTAN